MWSVKHFILFAYEEQNRDICIYKASFFFCGSIVIENLIFSYDVKKIVLPVFLFFFFFFFDVVIYFMTHFFFLLLFTDSLRHMHNSYHIMSDNCDTDSLGKRRSISNQAPGSSYSMHSKLDRQNNREGRHFKCSYCFTTWTNKIELQNHISRNHGDSLPYVCSLCGKGYRTAQGLALHIHVHEGRSFPCPLCASRFSQKGKVKRHLQNIHNATQCSTCSGIFLRGEEYNKHVLKCGINQ